MSQKENPRVLLVRDSTQYLKTSDVREYIEMSDIEVMAAVETKDEALGQLDQFRGLLDAGQTLQEFILLLDMNLTTGDFSGNDGSELIGKFREVIPQLIILSISDFDYPGLDNVEYVGMDPMGIVEKVNAHYAST